MLERIKNNPAILVGVVEALVALLVAFGLKLHGEQIAAIMGVVTVVLSVFVRGQVTPTRKL